MYEDNYPRPLSPEDKKALRNTTLSIMQQYPYSSFDISQIQNENFTEWGYESLQLAIKV